MNTIMATATKSPQTLIDRVYLDIKEAIICGDLAESSRVSIDKLCSQFNSSRTPVREAVRMLEANGFVNIRPQIGVEVTALSKTQFEELTELRLILETKALTKVYTMRDSLNFSLLDQLLALEAVETDNLALARIRQRIHLTLYSMCGQEELFHILRGIYEKSDRYVFYFADKTSGSSEHIHKKFVDTIRTADLDTIVTAVERHILKFKDQICNFLEQEGKK